MRRVTRRRRSPSTAHTVTNAEFAAFAAATGYVTDAERLGWSFVFGGLLPDDFPPTRAVARAPWWRQVEGATGATPRARSRRSRAATTIPWSTCRGTTRRPTARGPARGCRPRRSGSSPPAAGSRGSRFPWGDELEPGGEHRMNVWQGTFPADNSLADGYFGTCPVDAFAPNGYGLYNMTGNVWEWMRGLVQPRLPHARPAHRPARSAQRHAPHGRAAAPTCATHSYCRRYRVVGAQRADARLDDRQRRVPLRRRRVASADVDRRAVIRRGGIRGPGPRRGAGSSPRVHDSRVVSRGGT